MSEAIAVDFSSKVVVVGLNLSKPQGKMEYEKAQADPQGACFHLHILFPSLCHSMQNNNEDDERVPKRCFLVAVQCGGRG